MRSNFLFSDKIGYLWQVVSRAISDAAVTQERNRGLAAGVDYRPITYSARYASSNI